MGASHDIALLLFFACTDVEAFAVVEFAVGLVSAMIVILKFFDKNFYVFDFLSGHNSKEKNH